MECSVGWWYGVVCYDVMCCAVWFDVHALFLSAMAYSEETIRLWSERDVVLWLGQVRRGGEELGDVKDSIY